MRVAAAAAAHVHQPLHHLDVEAEALVDGVGLPPDAGLELEHLGLVHDEAVLKRRAAVSSRQKFLFFFLTSNCFASASATAFFLSLCQRHKSVDLNVYQKRSQVLFCLSRISFRSFLLLLPVVCECKLFFSPFTVGKVSVPNLYRF